MITVEQIRSAYSAIDHYFQAIRSFEAEINVIRSSEYKPSADLIVFFCDQVVADEMKQACAIAVELSEPFELILKAETPIDQRFHSGIWRDETLYFSVIEALDAWGHRMYQWGNRVLDRKRQHPYAWPEGTFKSPLNDEVVRPLLLRWQHEEQLLLSLTHKVETLEDKLARLDEVKRKAVRARIETSLSWPKIEKEFDISRSTIERAAKSVGIQLPDKSRKGGNK